MLRWGMPPVGGRPSAIVRASTSTAPRARGWAALAALAGLFVSNACTGDPPTVTPVPPTVDPLAVATAPPDARPLTIEVLNSELALGLERIAFRLKDEAGGQLRDGTVSVTYYRVLSQTGQSARQSSGGAVYFGGGLPDGGAWVVYTEFDSSGPWDMQAQVSRSDGTVLEGRTQVDVIGRTRTPAVGSPPPTGDTPVVAEGGDLASVSSDSAPDAALYRTTVAEASTSGKPTVVLFASPAACGSALCQAALDELKAVKQQYGDRINVIHVETHDPANVNSLTPAAVAWGVQSGPWLFVLDKRGLISARAEGGVDRTELGLLVDRVLGG